MKPIPEKLLLEAKAVAKRVQKNGYAPYSKFKVGAALLTGSGNIYAGCNFENASINTICAERSALASAIAAEGVPEIPLVVVYTPTLEPASPCGFCRQVLNEFNPNMMIVSFCDSDVVLTTSLAELLPKAFGPRNLSPNNKSV